MPVTTEPAPDQPIAGWPRAADALTVALLLLAAFVSWWGGRWMIGSVRISVSLRTVLALAGVVLAVRHVAVPRPAIHTRLRSGIALALARHPAVAAALPPWLATRPAVLLLGLVAVLMIGYPADSVVPRISSDELWNLPFRWDAGWYVSIASGGYRWSGSTSTQQNLVFFPVLPVLMRAVSTVFSPHVPLDVRLTWSGTALSVFAFLAALIYLYRLFVDDIGDEAVRAAMVFLATYPYALFFSAPYTESVYLLGAVAAFYHVRVGQTAAAAAWGLLVGLSRPNGCMLAVPLALAVLQRRDGIRLSRLAAAAMPVAGVVAYSVYTYSLTGRPFAWVELQIAWGRTFHGATRAMGDVAGALQQFLQVRSPSARVSEALNGVGALFALCTVWPVTRRLGIAYGAFVALGALVPLVGGGVDSMGRYTAVLFPGFVWLGLAVPARHRMAIAAAFAMAQGALAMLFFTWRPIF